MSLNMIPIILLIVNFGMLLVVSSGPTADYCDKERVICVNPETHTHTVCRRKNECGPIPPCIQLESTVAFRTEMVRQHNVYRNKLASGEDKSYGNTGATNMNALSYDIELEYTAACWNNECKPKAHDECRSTERFIGGQNIWWGHGYNATEDSIRFWYEEIKDMTDIAWIKNQTAKNYPTDDKQRGHFTQLVWAETKLVGCSVVTYENEKKRSYAQLICNYGPPGNVNTDPVYKLAKDASAIASECEGGIKNTDYPALCGKVLPIPTERMWTLLQEAGPSGSGPSGSGPSGSGPSGSGTSQSLGSIIGIVVAICVLLLAVFLLIFAKNTGRWCFSGPRERQLGESSDTESAEERSKYTIRNLIPIKLTQYFKKGKNNNEQITNEENEPRSEVADDPTKVPLDMTLATEVEDVKEAREEGGVVYAELDLINPGTKPVLKNDNDKTEYAEIVYSQKEVDKKDDKK